MGSLRIRTFSRMICIDLIKRNSQFARIVDLVTEYVTDTADEAYRNVIDARTETTLRYLLFVSLFLDAFIDDSRATNTTVKLSQLHAFGIDYFLQITVARPRDRRDCSRDAPRLYEESREAVKGSVRSFVYGNFVLGDSVSRSVCRRRLDRARRAPVTG